MLILLRFSEEASDRRYPDLLGAEHKVQAKPELKGLAAAP